MNVKKILSIVMVFTTVISFGGCNNKNKEKSSNKEGGTVVFSIPSDPDTINPAFATVREAHTVSNIVFSPLYIYKDGKFTYYLAENVTQSEDYKTLTIKLKENLKWHDGEKITSEDIVYTVNTILDKNQNSSMREELMIEGKEVKAKKVDDLTVEFTLPEGSSIFVSNLSKLVPIPKHVYDGETNVAKSDKNNSPIGSGPFKFKEWKKGDKIIFERFNDYFDGKPKADSIAVKISPDQGAQEAALNNGEITLMKSSVESFEKAKKDDKFQTYTYSEARLNYVVFNENKEYMKNEKFRKSLSYAMNRKDMIKSNYGEVGSKEAKSLLVPEADFYTENVEGYDFNLDKAKNLINESNAKVDKLKLIYNTGRYEHKNYALVTQQQLKELGIAVEIVPLESKAFFKTLFSKSNDFDFAINGYSWGFEPNPYRGMFETGTYYNQTGYSNKKVDELWNKGVKEIDREKRRAIYEEIQKLVAEDSPIYTIDYEQNLIVAQKGLKGIEEAKPTNVILFEDWSKLYISK